MPHLLWLKSGRPRPWVAKITGLDPTYGLARNFMAPVDKAKGCRAYLLDEGTLYQVQPASDDRYFAVVEEGVEKVLSTECALELVQAMEDGRKKIDTDVEAGLRRIQFDAEGGFRASEN